MGRFSEKIKDFYFKPGKGVEQPPPERGLKAYWFIAQTHFFKLITLNLIFILFCIPVVTIPSAITAMNRVLLNLVRKGYCYTFSDFFEAFKSEFLQSFVLGLFYAAFGFLVYFLSVNLANLFEGFAAGYGLALLAVFFILIYILASYSFALTALVNLSIGAVLKNSFIFLFVEFKRNFVLVGMAILSAGIIVLFPFSIPVILFLLFAFTQLAVCLCVNEAIQIRVIDPYY